VQPELHRGKFGVEATLRAQLLMSTALDDCTMVQDDDLIR
jgi:hypothetical protein